MSLVLTQNVSSDSAGDVVRIQPNHISFSSIHAFQDIYGQSTKASKDVFYSVGSKPASLLSEMSAATNNTTNDSDSKRHSFLRRVLNPSFAPASLRAFEPSMKQHFNRLIHGYSKRQVKMMASSK